MKAGSSYSSLVQGVSQQTAHTRRDGQHSEQVNMVPDPVRGLARRHPTRFVAQSAPFAPVPTGSNWRATTFKCLGLDYSVLTCKAPTALPVRVFGHSTNTFLTITPDASATAALAQGVQSVAAVGRFLLLVPKSQAPARTVVDNLAATGSKAAVWIRGGAYARKFTLTVTPSSGPAVSVNYTTPTSSYQGVLDTSDIPYAASDYAKQINDRVNAYNSAVTQWIGTAAAAIAPEAIATSLYNLVSPADRATLGMTKSGSYLFFTNATMVNVDDSGDSTLIRGVANRVLTADELTPQHFFGKTVRIQGKDSAESYYLKATAKGAAVGAVGEVIWEEAAGVSWTPDNPWVVGTVVGSTLFLSKTHAGLAALAGITVPPMAVSDSGDLDNNSPPAFTTEPTTFVGVLQDRLLVSAGGKLACSKTADYFNFSRTTVLTLPADDPFEVTPASGSDDLIRYSCLWERGMLLFGDDRQYAINGKTALTPTSVAMPVVSTHAGAGSVQPVVAGTSVFYSKPGDGASSTYELTPGQASETTDSFDVSTQLDDYILGNVVDMLITPEPTALLLRSDAKPNSVFMFHYLDTKAQGRVQDAWHRWDFSPALGTVAGMSVFDGDLFLFTLKGTSPDMALVCDRASMGADTSDVPYLDNQRLWAGSAPATATHAAMGPGIGVWAGDTIERAADLATRYGRNPIVGTAYESYVELTSPYVKDQKDRPILTGRTTISKIIVSCGQSLGFTWKLDAYGSTLTGVESSRIVGAFDNLLGVNTPTDFVRSVPVGRENKQYSLTLGAINWLPFTVDSVDWEGQLFNRTRRL